MFSRICLLTTLFFTTLLIPCFAQTAETIQIDTYYPAPYGSYAELTTTGNTYLATKGGSVGIGTTTPEAKLDVEGNIKIADGTQSVGRVLTSDASGLASWQDYAIKLCYCLHCSEGSHHSGSGWSCSENGGATPPNDTNDAADGCVMRAKIIPANQACSW